MPLTMSSRLLRSALFASIAAAVACSSDGGTSPSSSFLDGTPGNADIALVVNSTGRALTLVRLGDPGTIHQIPLGTSSGITPTGFSVRGERAAVPLGNAASVALVDLRAEHVDRYFTFSAGNATGVAFADDTTVIAANTENDIVGRFTIGQSGTAIVDTVPVAPAPTAVVMGSGRALVISGNLDENFTPIGDGIVTAIDPATMTVIDTVSTGGTNPSGGAIGPDGKLYVVNTGDYVSDGSVAVIDPATMTREAVISGFGPGPGSIHIDHDGIAYISSFSTGTVVWNTHTREFVRGPANPVCARLTHDDGQPCRGAFDATVASNGALYQLFFGSAAQGLAPYMFVYHASTFELADSVSVGVGPSALDIRSFRH